MTDKAHGQIPQAYETFMVPLLFEPYATDIAARVKKLGPSTILETAAGTGIVTEKLRDILPPDGNLLATDLGPGMLALATPKFSNDTNVKLEVMDATALSLPSNTFDAVVCQFAWMFFPDKLVAAREAFRVLVPGGHLVFNVWDSIDKNPATRIARETLLTFFGADPPSFHVTPFSMWDKDPIRRMVAEAGFTSIEIDTVPITSEVPSAKFAANGLVRGNPVITKIEERFPEKIDEIIDAVAAAIARELGDNPLRAPLQAHVIVAQRAT
jgi:ubiquinone/menaquinone biosynthesis C-methylase UbiE